MILTITQPGYLLVVLSLLIIIIKPLLPVVPEAVEGDGAPIVAAVIMGVFVPFEERRYRPVLLHGAVQFLQHSERQHGHSDVVKESLANGLSTRWTCMTVKDAEQNPAPTQQAGGAAPTILAGLVGWKRIAMETKDSIGGRTSGDGVAVFVGLVREDQCEGICRTSECCTFLTFKIRLI